MSLKKRGKHQYGDSQEDIRAEILRYSLKNGYVAQHFADAVCKCGGVFSKSFLTTTKVLPAEYVNRVNSNIQSATATSISKRPTSANVAVRAGMKHSR